MVAFDSLCVTWRYGEVSKVHGPDRHAVQAPDPGDESHVEVRSPDRSVTIKVSVPNLLVVDVAPGTWDRHTEATLERQVVAAARLALHTLRHRIDQQGDDAVSRERRRR